MDGVHPLPQNSNRYQIQVEGILQTEWAEWLNGQLVGAIHPDPSANLTEFLVDVPDQAALRGVINKIWDLNLTILSITRQ